jgi:sugar O-acyltransferase (sialic acid O-acetyltransferase NeuD family)
MKDRLLIIGASGHGKVVADIAIKMDKWKNIAFLDDDESLKTSMGLEVIGKSADAFLYINDCDIFVAIGNFKIRKEIISKLELYKATIPTLIHPTVIIGSNVDIGIAQPLCRAIINCCSKVGKGCIINTGATIDHDNVIGDFVHISPGAHLAGTVIIGNKSWIGIGAMISNNLNVTSEVCIGAGSSNSEYNRTRTYVEFRLGE